LRHDPRLLSNPSSMRNGICALISGYGEIAAPERRVLGTWHGNLRSTFFADVPFVMSRAAFKYGWPSRPELSQVPTSGSDSERRPACALVVPSVT
jgi:hypothetical protein